MFKTLQPQGLKTYIGTDFHAEIVTYVSRKERTRFFLTKNHVKSGCKSNDLHPLYLIRILFYIGVTPHAHQLNILNYPPNEKIALLKVNIDYQELIISKVEDFNKNW